MQKKNYKNRTPEKARTFERVDVDAARRISLSPAMRSALVQWTDGMGGRVDLDVGDRAPVMFRDSSGAWWWCGLRRFWRSGNGLRCSIRGRQLSATRQSLQTVEGVAMVWVVDEMGMGGGRFALPFPLESPEDARDYWSLRGWNRGTSSVSLASSVGWRGPDAARVAGGVVELLDQMRLDSTPQERFAELRRELSRLVILPPAPSGGGADGGDVRRMVEELRAELADLRAELARVWESLL